MIKNKSILELTKKRVVILDGAMGSVLISQGLKPGEPPESWNINYPEKIKAIHQQYFEAGSDVVLTNTFGGSKLKLAKLGHGDKMKEYNEGAVLIAKEVCPSEKFVAGDIGPSGQFLAPVGNATVDDFEKNFLDQAVVLEKAGVDLFYIETMQDIKEAEAAVKAVKNVSNKPVFCSITFQKTKRGYFTIMGNSVEQCVSILENVGADVIGANCTIDSKDMIDLIPILEKFTGLPLLAKPNAGQPQLIDGKTVYDSNPKEFAADIQKMIDYGAKIVGGCCGSNPKFIQEINKVVKGES